MYPSSRRLLGLAALVACLPLSTAAAAAPPARWRPFAPDSVWNLPLRTDAPLLADSGTHVAWLRTQNAASGMWINSGTCGMPEYWADADTPRVTVTLDASAYQDRGLIRAWHSVPIPTGVRPSNCSDQNFAVLQTQPDGSVAEWEFWAATQAIEGTWTARWGGATQDVRADRGVASSIAWNDPTAPAVADSTSNGGWNVTASSVSMTAGVITIDDMNRGIIDHALAVALPETAKSRWLWPAQRTDGGSTDPAALPEGARLRIDPSVNLDTITMTPIVRMMAEAAQRYGIVVRDRTHANTAFYTEEPKTAQTSPLSSLLAGKYPDTALAQFPWDRLQVLDAPSCTTWAKCTVTPKVVIDSNASALRVGESVELDTTNSVLEHPRKNVEWDFDGDGRYETAVGRAVKSTFTPQTAGSQMVGVRITTLDGATVTGEKTIDVAPPLPAINVVRRPSALVPTWFYSFSWNYTSLTAITADTVAPYTPAGSRKLYTGSTSGGFDVTFGGDTAAAATGATASAWVECSAARCMRLCVVDGAGTVLGSTDPPFGRSAWVSIRVPGPLSAAQVGQLRLKGNVRNASSASGTTALSSVRLSTSG
jgi:hypothetical protein